MIGPEVMAIQAVDQLGSQSYPVPSLSNAPLQDIASAEEPANLTYVSRLPLEHEAGVASDNEQLLYFGQRRQQVIGDAIREPLLLRITAQVRKRQDRKRRLVGNWQRHLGWVLRRNRCCRRVRMVCGSRANSKEPHWAFDILQCLLTKIIEYQIRLSTNLIE